LAEKKKIGLAILNKNEIIGAKELINKIDQSLFNEIICIDGGSTDGSNKFIESKGIKVLQQKSSGRGEAFQLAIREMGERLDGIVFFSLDGNEDPKDLKNFVIYFEKEFDLIIANRMGKNSVNEEEKTEEMAEEPHISAPALTLAVENNFAKEGKLYLVKKNKFASINFRISAI
jgi:glycosyltransferase involved in cell wall biosynthesis